MNLRRLVKTGFVTFGLVTAMHLDWHVARPATHHLSLGWEWHWLFAIPVFALAAWFVSGTWPDRRWWMSLTIIGVASLLAAVVQPAFEYWSGASFEWAFGRVRLTAFAEFTAAGAITHVLLLGLIRMRNGT